MADVGTLMAWSARHPWRVLGAAAGLSVVAVAILLFVPPEVETDIQAGTFPEGHPQAEAFRALRAEVAGINSELVYLELRGDARGPNGPVTNVTDQQASIVIDEMFHYIDARFLEETGQDKVIAYTGYPYLLKLVHSYFPYGSYEVPRDPDQYNAAASVLASTDDGSLDFYFSDDYRSTVFSIVYDPAGDKAATAGLINELIAEYRELPVGPGKSADLWKDEYTDGWGIQSWIYRVDESVEQDIRVLVPVVLAFLGLVLWWTFRSPRRALSALLVVGAVQVWTLAAMTLAGLPIGFISMALFPLLLGVGVDYAIHVQHEAMIERGRLPLAQALEATGRKAGAALTVATATTIFGFLIIMASRSPMIVQVATATVIGMAFVWVAALTVLPALIALMDTARPQKEFKAPEVFARGVSRHRVVAGLVALAIVGVSIPYAMETSYAIETVQGNLPTKPEKSHMLVMYERFVEKMEASGQEMFIHQGDLTSPAVMEDIIQVHLAMEDQGFFGGVLSLPFVIDLHQALSGGQLGPAAIIPETVIGQVDPPERFARVRELDQQGLRDALDAMWQDERWTVLVQSFTSAAYDITWTFSFINVVSSPEATQQADDAMRAILEKANPGVYTEYFGTLTALKVINDQTTKWLTISAVADLAILGLLVGIVSRSVRAVVTVSVVLGGGMLVWLGLLASPVMALPLSFVYLVPLAFITSLGSDYVVHMVLSLEQGERPASYRHVGRAIAFSVLTTAGAFLIFTRGAVPASESMFQACVAAIAVSALLTALIVPIAYPIRSALPRAR